MRARRSGYRAGTAALVAAAAMLVLAPSTALAGGGAKPNERIFLRYSYFDDVVPAGGERTIEGACPGNQVLLSTSAATGLERTFVDGVVPGTDSVRVAFSNTGSSDTEATIGVKCIKGKRAELDTDVVRDRIQVAAGETGSASASCKGRGSIPAAVGFAGNGTTPVGGTYVKQGRNLGFQIDFAGTSGGRGEVRMTCLTADGAKVKGRFTGQGLTRTPRAREPRGGQAALSVDFGSAPLEYNATLSGPETSVFTAPVEGTPWSSPFGMPVPSLGNFGAGMQGFGFGGFGGPNPLEILAAIFFGNGNAPPAVEVATATLTGTPGPIRERGRPGFDANVFGGGGDGGGGGPGTGSKTVRPLQDASPVPDCNPGFIFYVYIDADAQSPTHTFLDNGGNPPCPGATVTVEVFPAGTKPPGNTDTLEGWRNHQTYQVRVSSMTSGLPSPQDFAVRVDWTDPSP